MKLPSGYNLVFEFLSRPKVVNRISESRSDNGLPVNPYTDYNPSTSSMHIEYRVVGLPREIIVPGLAGN